MSIDEKGLIFATGAPGSRWSSYCRLLSCAEEIDNTDESEERTFVRHFGNYFGPSMEFGHRFHELDQIGRAAMLDELAKAYTSGGTAGRLLIKSHHFANHLPLLREWFPDARIVIFYRTDQECLDHWYFIGGFEIPFPLYDWYEDREGMIREIAHQNRANLAFIEEHGLELKRYTDTTPLFEKLGLHLSEAKLDKAMRELGFTDEEQRERFLDRGRDITPAVAVY